GADWLANSVLYNNGTNIGIGTVGPDYKLDVQNGQVNASGGLCIAGDCKTAWSEVSNLPTGTSGQTLRHDGADWLANSVLYNNGTGVGIGTTSPNYRLHVYQDSGNNAEIDIQSTSAADSHWGIYHARDETDELRFWKNDADQIRFDDDGSITAFRFLYSSDKNLKKDIKIIENPLSLVNQLQGVKFTWKENNLPSIGLIAQEVEKVLPELVVTDSKNNKYLQYANLTAVLIEAIKELSQQVEQLQAKN
ncbi:tail fiber domain-containing protein, partial [Patescibacteria group bacterium]|nr:tail fiber domain-containing protein [Patescibacteria group bacterium]